MDHKRTYIAPVGTEVRTSVDPMGLQVLIVFDEEGRFETTDPGLIGILERLADAPGHSVERETD